MSMTIRFDVESDTGRERPGNEDMALVMGQQIRDGGLSVTVPVDSETCIAAIVCDGMGGYEGGEVASPLSRGWTRPTW